MGFKLPEARDQWDSVSTAFASGSIEQARGRVSKLDWVPSGQSALPVPRRIVPCFEYLIPCSVV